MKPNSAQNGRFLEELKGKIDSTQFCSSNVSTICIQSFHLCVDVLAILAKILCFNLVYKKFKGGAVGLLVSKVVVIDFFFTNCSTYRVSCLCA